MSDVPFSRMRLKDLAQRIKKARDAYYNHDHSFISDAQYDALEKEYRHLSSHFHENDSVLETVGAPVGKSFAQVKHHHPMLSLRNAFDKETVKTFIKNVRVFLKLPPDKPMPMMLVEHKIDGLSLSLHYHRGKLVRGSTRGDGHIGEDVTANARAIKDIPHQLSGKSLPQDINIRGEVYMTREAFSVLNHKEGTSKEGTSKEGISKTSFATSRHATGASLRLKDATITARRNLHFFAYGALYQERDHTHKTLTHLRTQIARWNIPVVPLLGRATSINDLEDHHKSAYRASLPYDTDGIVCKVDSLALQKRLGNNPKAPRWALAYKFPSQKVVARVGAIETQVGRTGKITPLAQLEKPVLIDGIRIQRVALNGFHYGGEQKPLEVGDDLEVELVGGAIPQIYRMIEDEKSQSPTILDCCPSCGNALSLHPVEKSSVNELFMKCFLFCRNRYECMEQFVAMMCHFVGRDAMNITGLGEETIRELIDQGLLREPADLFTLKTQAEKKPPEGWLLSKKGTLLPDSSTVFTKRITSLFASIEEKRSSEITRVLFAFGIPDVGLSSCRMIATLLPQKEQIAQLINNIYHEHERPQTLEVKEDALPERILRSLKVFLADKHNFLMINNVLHQVIPPVIKSASLAGKSILFKTPLKISIREAHALARSRRMTIKKSSKDGKIPDYVVYGEGQKSKIDDFPKSILMHEDDWLTQKLSSN